MAMQSEEKDTKGRQYYQSTHDGTSSAGSVGTGGTGNAGAMGEQAAGQGSQQSASRSDDLLAGDTARQEADRAFSGSRQGGQVQTGMEGIGKGSGAAGGSQQSGEQSSQQGAMPPSQTDDDQYDQGTARRAQ